MGACMLSHIQLFRTTMDCSPQGFSVHGIFQARILKWVAIFSSRGSSPPRDWTWVSSVSCIAFFTYWALGEELFKPETPFFICPAHLFFIYNILCYLFFFIFILFIWLHQILVAALGWDFHSCNMQILAWGMWDLVPWPGIELHPRYWEYEVLATEPPGKSSSVLLMMSMRISPWWRNHLKMSHYVHTVSSPFSITWTLDSGTPISSASCSLESIPG